MTDGKSLIFRSITLRNFLSFGNQEQVIILDQDLLSVVLGENMDTGGEDSRNGAGKSAIIDALCYALFGKTLRGTPNMLLINDLVARGQPLSVRVEFEKGKYSYLVERGEKPSKLLLLRKPVDNDEDFYARKDRKLKFDISLASKAETTKEIVKLLGYNLPLFSYLVANSSESTPFFKLHENERREVTENLFGFTILSERAERLKKKRKVKKDELIKAETEYATEVQANQRIEEQIKVMERRSADWSTKRDADEAEISDTIQALAGVDTEAEIKVLKELADVRQQVKEVSAELRRLQSEYSSLERDQKTSEREITTLGSQLKKAEEDLEEVGKNICPTCGQHWVADPEYTGHLKEVVETIPEQISEEEVKIGGIAENMQLIETDYVTLEEAESDLKSQLKQLEEIELTFSTPEEAAEASASLKLLNERLEELKAEDNPYDDSIVDLRDKAVKTVSDAPVKELQKLINHFDFMVEMLTSKDSFIRRRIIDQWLPKLNEHIALYLDILEQPYQVEFQPDMTATIVKYQKEKSWGNLSKGERMRLVIALNFAFQDIFEYMNYRINLLCVDELLDSGICSRGAERGVDLLKALSANSHKRIMLITHRDDIAARVDHMMIVRKENDISKIYEAE